MGLTNKISRKLEEEQNKKTMKNKKTIYHLPPTTRKTMKNKENRLTITTYGQFKYYVITFGEEGRGGGGWRQSITMITIYREGRVMKYYSIENVEEGLVE